jgi:hypothetical protein
MLVRTIEQDEQDEQDNNEWDNNKDDVYDDAHFQCYRLSPFSTSHATKVVLQHWKNAKYFARRIDAPINLTHLALKNSALPSLRSVVVLKATYGSSRALGSCMYFC